MECEHGESAWTGRRRRVLRLYPGEGADALCPHEFHCDRHEILASPLPPLLDLKFCLYGIYRRRCNGSNGPGDKAPATIAKRQPPCHTLCAPIAVVCLRNGRLPREVVEQSQAISGGLQQPGCNSAVLLVDRKVNG